MKTAARSGKHGRSIFWGKEMFWSWTWMSPEREEEGRGHHTFAENAQSIALFIQARSSNTSLSLHRFPFICLPPSLPFACVLFCTHSPHCSMSLFPYYFTPTHKTWPKTFLLHSYGCISNISSLSGIDTMCLKRKKKKKEKKRSTKGKVNLPLRLDK